MRFPGCRRRRGVGHLVESLHGKVDKVLTDLTALNNAVDTLVANEATVATELGALRDDVAQLSAGTITQEQIDGIAARVTEVGEKLAADAAPAAPPAPAEGAPAGGEAPDAGGATPPGDEAPAGGETAPPPGEGGEAQPA